MSGSSDGRPLLDVLERATRGQSGFRLLAADGGANLPARRFDSFRSQLIFWPLPATRIAAIRVLEALRDGVVPVLLPPAMPEGKLDALRLAHPRFGMLHGEKIIPAPDPARADRSLFCVFVTSGSTATPRLIAASEAALRTGVETMHIVQRLEAVSVAGILVPLHFAFAFVNQFLWAVRFERDVFLAADIANPVDAHRALRASGAEMICVVSSQVRLLQSLGVGSDESSPQMRVVNVGGGPFPAACLPLLRTLFPVGRIINNYGCTEALTRLASCEVADDHRPTDAGSVFPAIELRIGGAEAIGPIEFRGSSVSFGTVQPDGSVQPHPPWIQSGDLGRFEAERLHVLGRRDQVFKSGGERISLVEVEHVLASVSPVTEAIAWAHADALGDQHAWVVVKATGVPEPDDVRRAVRRQLSRNAWPVRVFWVDQWPLLGSGKPDRAELQRRAEAGELKVAWERRGAGR
jgi:O-succinylbenzoic acid--CoA ligase